MAELPTGTVTLLFTDIEGSTRLLHELGAEAYARELAEHRRVMREVFSAHDGVEVDTQGDAFFVAFPDARQALDAAARAQEALSAGPIRVRMGVHSGEPLLTEEGYVGIDVHRGARVMSAGHGGQVVVSHETFVLLEGGAGLIELGSHRLKDLTEPQPLYQLGSDSFPPLKTLFQTNLPVQPTPLVGREEELADVLRLLSESRLLTLTGAGGSGKTRLALQAAAEVVDEYKDGVWWVSLAALRDPALLESTIAQAVGAKDGLAEQLRTKQLLLLLDNFEQLLSAAPLIATLLSEAPEVRVLATSRERLGVSAEQEYEVPTLASAEAVALFTARARQLKPEFDPDEHVAEICRRLDGLPLAVELGAARVKVLTPAQILERLQKGFHLLTGGARDAPERQQTLEATIEWSYELLDETERRLFASLSVFAGSFDVDAVDEICSASVDTLQSLVDKSLLRQTQEGRFFLLETIREYARERLAEAHGERVRERHARYFFALVEDLQPLFLGPEEPVAHERLALEHDNLREALRFTIDAGDAASALRAATGPLQRFWRIQGLLEEGRRWLEESLAGVAEPTLRANGLRALANIASAQGDASGAIAAAEEAAPIFRERGDVPNLIDCLNALGGAAMRQGDTQAARRCFEEAEQLSRVSDDAFRLQAAVENLGLVSLYEGAFDRAGQLFAEGLELARELALEEAVASSLVNSGIAALQKGENDRAGRQFREAVEIASSVGDALGVVYGCECVGAALAAGSNWESAVIVLAGAETLRATIGLDLEPLERKMHDDAIDLVRSNLAKERFNRAWTAGQSMTEGEVVSYALAALD